MTHARSARAVLALAAALAAFCLGAAAPARARVVRVPLEIDPSFLSRLLAAQVFTGPAGTLRLRARDRCSEVVLAAPPIEVLPGRLHLESAARARGGIAMAGGCLRLFRWNGTLEASEEPYLDGGSVRFRVRDSALHPRGWSLLPQEPLWSWLRPEIHPRLEALRLDVRPALDDLARLLPLFAARADVAPAQRLADSLALDEVTAVQDHVRVVVRFEVDDAAAAPRAPREAPLRDEERAAFEAAAGRVDAFLTFVVKQLGRDAIAPAVRDELLRVLLATRTEAVAALAGAADPDAAVRALFLSAWSRLAPLVRQIEGDLPAESALRYLSFLAAGDALAALDAAAPSFGLDLSGDGLRRLARTLAPSAPGDPLERSAGVDPELRALFGFGPPLPVPAEGEPTPDGVREPDGGLAPEPPPSSRLLRGIGSALADLVAAPAYAAPPPAAAPDAAADAALAALGRRLDRWAPSLRDYREYLPLAGRLLRGVAGQVNAASDLALPYRDLHQALVLATGWQESCWRQYVVRGEKLVPVRSRTGDVGLMQVNERVWRGFYALDALRWDVGYNVRAGSEILLHYLRDGALARNEDRRGGLQALARASYAMYNGGPAALSRWRDPQAPAAFRAVDAAFFQKYLAMRANDDAKLESCFVGPAAPGDADPPGHVGSRAAPAASLQCWASRAPPWAAPAGGGGKRSQRMAS